MRRQGNLWLAWLAWLGWLALLAACSGPLAVPDSSYRGQPRRAVPAAAERREVVILPEPIDIASNDLGPGVLMPSRKADDTAVEQVGEFKIRKSHVYDRLIEEDPKATKADVDHLVFDVFLALEAQKHEIRVDSAKVYKVVEEEVELLAERVKKEWGGQMSLQQYMQQEFGVSLQTYRVVRRRLLARMLYRNYVIRFLGLLEDRVEVRLIWNRDGELLEKLAKRVSLGAEFATLALRHSEHDDSRRRGGLVPAFGRDAPHVFAEDAFRLKEGDLSEVLSKSREGVTEYFLLYCVARKPGRKVGFKEVQEELDEDIRKNPVTATESNALYIRMRSQSEARNNLNKERGGR